MGSITVIAPGQEVCLLQGDDGWQQAFVIQVAIGLGNVVEYSLVYWKDGERKSQWVKEFEVRAKHKDDERVFIGFQTHNKSR